VRFNIIDFLNAANNGEIGLQLNNDSDAM